MNGDLLLCVSIAAGCGVLLLCSRLRAPLLADEGYLWYGVQQLMGGRLPHRDFKSYEPGRYFWSGVFALFIGPGLLTLRIATHLFFAVGLTPALLVCRELGFSWTSVVFAAVALSAWSYPQHKQFECGWWPMTWAAYTHALLAPSATSAALAGATIGLALLFGFNLFLYSSVAVALIFGAAFVAGLPFPDLPAFTVGAAAGAAPFLLLLLSPQFARAFYRRRIGSVIFRGSANLPLPLPWPWRGTPAAFEGMGAARARAFQWVFAMMVALPAPAATFTLVQLNRLGPVAFGLLSAGALAIPASHHALSRADPPHVAQSMGPVCLIAVLLAAHFPGAWAVACVAGICLWLTWPLHRACCGSIRGQLHQQRRIGGLLINLSSDQAKLFDKAAALCGEASCDRGDFFAAPFYPEIYAVLERDAPVYDTYCVHPPDEPTQREMIAALERAQVRVALVSDQPIDRRDELRFSQTLPAVWQHLHTNFEASTASDLAPDILIFRRRASVDGGGVDAAAR